MLIDSHCHLDFPECAADMAGVVARAKSAGVELMVNISTAMREFPATLAVAEKYPEVWCSVGVHPEHCADAGESVDAARLADLATHPRVVGIGETGLDYHYEGPPHEIQKTAFREHLAAAAQSNLPVIIHSREAEDDTAQMLRQAHRESGGKLTGLLHCFSSHRRLAEAALEIGFYVSFSGILTFKKSTELREIARAIPKDRILVETDAPFLAPEPYRGKTCEPAHVVHTARKLAETIGVEVGEIERLTTENFFRLFKKAKL